MTDSKEDPLPGTSNSEDKLEFNELTSDSPLYESFNPPLPHEINQEDIEKIKGDAIGDTLYSERYVLSVLLKLSNLENNFNDAFEEDLCTLWDMTIERDVVKLLLQHDVLELFGLIIQTSNNVRLTEIIVGIIGNMCCFAETRDKICFNNDVMLTILNLIDNDDALTLIQLMRFFKTALIFENTGDEAIWFQHFCKVDNFIEKFSFILSNSTSTTLILNSLEALVALFNKFSVFEIQRNHCQPIFLETFVKSCLVSGLIEAFKQTLSHLYTNEMSDSAESSSTTATHQTTSSTIDTPTEKNQKIMMSFLEINSQLSQYENLSPKIFEPYLSALFDCISRILNPLCQPINLLPLNTNTQDIIENINEIFQGLGDPFDEKCFIKCTLIWSNIKKFQDEYDLQDSWGDTSNDDISTEDICMTLLEYITRVNKNSNQSDLNNALKIIGIKVTENLLKEISIGESEPDIEKCCSKLKCGLKTIWNI